MRRITRRARYPEVSPGLNQLGPPPRAVDRGVGYRARVKSARDWFLINKWRAKRGLSPIYTQEDDNAAWEAYAKSIGLHCESDPVPRSKRLEIKRLSSGVRRTRAKVTLPKFSWEDTK